MLGSIRFLSLLFFIQSGSILYAQIVDVPDPIFKQILISTPCADYDGDGIFESDVDLNDDGEIQASEAAPVKGLQMQLSGILDLTGIGSFVSLEYLNCAGQELTALDLSKNIALKEVLCGLNHLVNIDVTQCLFLEVLSCQSNMLTSIDVSANPNLIYLTLGGNELIELNISNNTHLETLGVGLNNLTELNVSNQPDLIILGFEFNQIKEIDLTQNLALENLSFAENKIEVIDLSYNTGLKIIYGFGNSLSSFDISNNPLVTHVYCDNNNLEYLNVANGNNVNFYGMNATGNPNLVCIQVDDVPYSNNQECLGQYEGWCKDETATYSEFCELGVDTFKENILTVAPNPAKDYVYFDVLAKDITLYDSVGRLVLNATTVATRLDVSTVRAGVYFLQLETNQGTIVKRLTKE